MSQMNEETRSIPYYSQSFYPKMSHLQSSAMYLPYDSFSPMYMQQHTNGSNYQNYQYMPGKADYYQQDEQFDSFGNRPHFFSQNNINLEEKKNFNMGGSFKKMTQKKNSLMMKNNVFSSPNGFDRNDNELDLDCDPKSLFEFCKDQLGSRKIQMFFEKGKEEEKETLFLKVENQLLFLIKDVFGNYVVQKMLERGNSFKFYLILNLIFYFY